MFRRMISSLTKSPKNNFDAVIKKYINVNDKSSLIHIRVNENADAITALTREIDYLKSMLININHQLYMLNKRNPTCETKT